MALPKIKHPTYTIVIPSIKKQVNIRPFTVQEEKLLLMAKQSESTDDVITAIKQIIKNCVIEPIEVDKLTTFDVEYLFIKLRSKSIGELIDLEYKDPDTSEVIKFKLNLDDVEVVYNLDHKSSFNIHDDIGVTMRYPTLNEIKVIESSEDEKTTLQILFKCIDKVYDNETVYTDFTSEELEDFINNLPMDSMQNIKTFFDTMPSVEHEIKLKNKEGKVREVKIKGLSNFFT